MANIHPGLQADCLTSSIQQELIGVCGATGNNNVKHYAYNHQNEYIEETLAIQNTSEVKYYYNFHRHSSSFRIHSSRLYAFSYTAQ